MISFSVSVTTTPPTIGSTAWVLRIKCTADGMTPSVFAIQLDSKQGTQTETTSRFSHICSLAQLEEYPENDPSDGWYYRVSDITLIFDSEVLCTTTKNLIISDIQYLVKAARAAYDSSDSSDTEEISL